MRGRIRGGGQDGGFFPASLECFFQLPWRLPLGEHHGKELLCIKERQGRIFSSRWFMLRGRVHVLAERKEGEKGDFRSVELLGLFALAL